MPLLKNGKRRREASLHNSGDDGAVEIQVPRTSDAARVSEAAQQPTLLPWQMGGAAVAAVFCHSFRQNCPNLPYFRVNSRGATHLSSLIPGIFMAALR
jgi:hypothetical protein